MTRRPIIKIPMTITPDQNEAMSYLIRTSYKNASTYDKPYLMQMWRKLAKQRGKVVCRVGHNEFVEKPSRTGTPAYRPEVLRR